MHISSVPLNKLLLKYKVSLTFWTISMLSLVSPLILSYLPDQRKDLELMRCGTKLRELLQRHWMDLENHGKRTQEMVLSMDQRLMSRYSMLLRDITNVVPSNLISTCQSGSTSSIRLTKMLKKMKRNRSLKPKSSQLMNMTIMPIPGRSSPSRRALQDQSWSTELSWDQLRDSWLFWLSILLENGHSSSHQDKFLFAQLDPSSNLTVRRSINIFTQKVTIVNSILHRSSCQTE